MANEIQYRNHTAYNNGTSAEDNIKLLDITPFQHEDLSSGVNKLGKMLIAQSFCEPVAVCNSNNPQNGAYVATCQNYPDFALSYQDAQQNTKYLIGLKIRVIFTHGITYGSVSGGTYPTLNINGSGAIPMLAQGKTMASGAASAGQSIEFTIIPYGNGVAFDADSNVRESTSDYTIYTDGTKVYKKTLIQGVRWSAGIFEGEVYQENGIKYIIGYLTLTSSVTAYSTVLGSLYNTDFPVNKTSISFLQVGSNNHFCSISSGYNLLSPTNLSEGTVLLINIAIPNV